MWYRIRGSKGIKMALSGARRQRGMTQAELAELMHIDRTTLLNMESGKNIAVTRLIEAFSLLGFDLLAVPRTAEINVTENNEPAS
ncbi:MAG TPA: transcriptional regulator [Micromonosporaceae bacterium]|nr:transcriptional regulator [Micromonosporaceae bacterium]HCU51545.1 transcriptional regulator [Micromonosporaceae bacterium]